MAFILDASAILALLFGETGETIVRRAIREGGGVCALNLAEVATVLVRKGAPIDEVRMRLGRLPAEIHDLDSDLGMRAAALYPLGRDAGLSLGDRVCIALAQREGMVAVSGDRAWVSVASAIGVELLMIR